MILPLFSKFVQPICYVTVKSHCLQTWYFFPGEIFIVFVFVFFTISILNTENGLSRIVIEHI